MISFFVLTTKQATPSTVKDLNVLMDQMSQSKHSSHRISLRELKAALKDKNTFILVAKDKTRIVATGSLFILHSAIGVRARMEDVVVHEEYRGRGLGVQISKKLIVLAKKNKTTSVEITSRPNRVAAIALYEKLGFKQTETNVYRLHL